MAAGVIGRVSLARLMPFNSVQGDGRSLDVKSWNGTRLQAMTYVCVPVHNEARTAGLVLGSTSGVSRRSRVSTSCWFLDDASTDTPRGAASYAKVLPMTIMTTRAPRLREGPRGAVAPRAPAKVPAEARLRITLTDLRPTPPREQEDDAGASHLSSGFGCDWWTSPREVMAQSRFGRSVRWSGEGATAPRVLA